VVTTDELEDQCSTFRVTRTTPSSTRGVVDARTVFLQKLFTPDAVARKVREVLKTSWLGADGPLKMSGRELRAIRCGRRPTYWTGQQSLRGGALLRVESEAV